LEVIPRKPLCIVASGVCSAVMLTQGVKLAAGRPLPRAFHLIAGTLRRLDPPTPPPDLLTISDPPTEADFPDQHSEEANRPFFDDFSWRIFVALNWPAVTGRRGVPDKSKAFGDPSVSSTVWETWKASYEIIPPNAEQEPPTPWDSFRSLLPFGIGHDWQVP